MGLFGGGYSKAGPGVDKNAPKKKGIFLYIEIFMRKFWKLVQANLLYFLVSLPIIAIYYILAPVSSETVLKLLGEVANDPNVMANAQMTFRGLFSLVIFALWGSGPATAGYTFVLRNFVREQHSWILTDFFAKFKENFLHGLIVAVIDVVLVFLAITAFPFYYYNFIQTGSIVWMLVCYALGLALLIYTFMHYYIYQMMITFECNLIQLYRNSIIMAFAKLPMNFILTILGFVIIRVSFFLNPAFAIVLSLVLWISMAVFPIIFYTSRVMQKSFLDELQTEEDNIERICSDEEPKESV